MKPFAKKGGGKRKAILPPSYTPHPCVVLTSDCAKVSGWCIMLYGSYHSSGQVDCMRHHAAALEICARATALAKAHNCKAVLVFERPFRGTVQGGFSGHWRSAWRAAGGVKTREVGVYPASWRARVLGSARLKRDAAQEREVRVASLVAPMVGQDECAAVCIALWAIRAGAIGKVLAPKKAKAA
jgi:hypothetical protein